MSVSPVGLSVSPRVIGGELRWQWSSAARAWPLHNRIEDRNSPSQGSHEP